MRPDDPRLAELNRRAFLTAMVGGAVVAVMPKPRLAADGRDQSATLTSPAAPTAPLVEVSFVLNGEPVQLSVDPRVTLLDGLREQLGCPGTKKGCDHGQCGACTVHIDGRRVLACLTLLASVSGHDVTTIEGLGSVDALHPMQQAFIAHDGFQCGYCTAGQIMSAVSLLTEPCGPADDDVREAMSGNLCRCGAYPGIVKAIQSVRGVDRSKT